MKIERNADGYLPSEMPQFAIETEADGYDGICVLEATRDPFVPLFLAAEHTEKVRLRTAIAVALARNPMTTASIAHDLQRFSQGRFSLGLGSQIRAHVERRFSMPGDRLAARMIDFVGAVRAIWRCWDEQEPLDYRGEFYTHTLMPPRFMLDPSGYPPPPIYLAGVGMKMTEAAGQVADGYLAHSFSSVSYLKEVTVPALERGRAKADKSLDGFDVSGLILVATGSDQPQLDRAIAEVKQAIAFYGSTPAYAPVLEHHGRRELHERLHEMSKTGGWRQMPDLIDDELLHTIAVVGEPAEVGREISRRYDGLFETVCLSRPEIYEREAWREVLAAAAEAPPVSS